MKVYDRVWLKLNRKPHGKFGSYLFVVVPWIVVGFLLTLVFLGLILTKSWLGVFFGVFTIVVGLIYFLIDKRQGYVDSIHSNYLSRRDKKLKELDIDVNK